MPPKDMLYLLILINGINIFVASHMEVYEYNLVKYMVLILWQVPLVTTCHYPDACVGVQLSGLL